jgi:hypothetical protein
VIRTGNKRTPPYLDPVAYAKTVSRKALDELKDELIRKTCDLPGAREQTEKDFAQFPHGPYARLIAQELWRRSLTRSSRYRLAKGKPLLWQAQLVPETYRTMIRSLRRMEKAATDAFEWTNAKPPDKSCSEWMDLREDDQFMRRHRAKVASDVHVGQASTTRLRQQGQQLEAKGMKRKDIAVELGCSDRWLRELMGPKNKKRK